jgi:hypothetical protein
MMKKKSTSSNASIQNKNKNNTKTTTTPKTVCLDEYKNFKLGNTFITNTMMEQLGKDLVAWAENDPNALKLKSFYEREGIGEKKFNEWCTKFPDLAEYRAHAKMIIGNRREIGALRRELDGRGVYEMMPHYDQDWDDALARKESLKNRDGEGSGDTKIICVGLDKFPDCPEVKPLKKEKDGQ